MATTLHPPLAHGRLGLTQALVLALAIALLHPSGASAADAFSNSFEDAEELNDWECQQGITTELTTRWASDGKSALQINVPAGTPWFGIQRDVKLEELRQHAFLEFDLHALTEVDYAALTMRAPRFQEFIAVFNRMKPGETTRVRIPLADNEIVRFGETATISLWMTNGPEGDETLLVDNVRLTGSAGERDGLEDYAYARILERMIAEGKAKPALTANEQVWLGQAEEALKVPPTLVKSLTQYNRSTADLYEWRDRIAGAITSSPFTEVNPWQEEFRLKKINPRQPQTR